MQGVTLSIASLFCLFSISSASVCVVSFWSEWNSCVGNCQFALRVRNRNVIRPPFPERTSDGRLAIRPCPSLYQVQTCIPPPCLLANRNETAFNSVDSNIDPGADSRVDSASIDGAVVSVQKDVAREPERAGVEKLPQSVEGKSKDAEIAPRPPTDNPLKNTKPQKVSSQAGVATVSEVGKGNRVVEPLQQVPNGVEGKASVVEVVSSTHSANVQQDTTTKQAIERLTETPLKTEVTVEVGDPAAVQPEEPVTGEAPSTAAVAAIDEAQTVVDANGNSNATSEESQPEATSPTGELSQQPSTQVTIEEDNLAVSTLAPELENVASNSSEEIRRSPLPVAKPFRRNTKPCGVPGGNSRCCRLATRTECPDGEKPQSVMRWSRMADNDECHSYNYAYCGIDVELEEAPIKFEQNCYDLCFTDEEKNTLEVFNDQQFRDGFRVRL
uniref:BPTI/Kunitz inhibitor domain-containing protein n=1 Tax=Plectus sambesii TaxID=2011161 RepID=A0A914W059_9BILA